MNVTALLHDYNDKSGEQSFHINSFVAAGLLHIIGQYFSKWSNYFVLTLCCRDEHTCNFYNDMFQKIFAGWSEWPIQIVIVQRNKYTYVTGNREYNMIFTDSYKALLETEIHTYTAQYNTNEYYYIFLQARDHLLANEMQNIFEYCWQHYLINCIVQIQNSKGEMLFYTYYPFTANHCGKVEAVLINEYNGTALVREELFPKKLTNLYGCPLKAALWHVPPYIYLTTDLEKHIHISGGFEGKLLLELADKLNFTLNIKIPENDSQRGVVLKNGSLTGALKMLDERQADLGMGSFRKSGQRSLKATATMSYYQTYMVAVTLSDAFLLTSRETVLYPFTAQLWYLLFALSFVVSVSVTLITHLYRKKLPRKAAHGTLDVLLMLLGMPAIYKPKQDISKILNATWMFYAILIRTIYQALLFHLIRAHVTRDVPQMLEELVINNFSMVANLQTAPIIGDISSLRSINVITLNSSSDNIPLKYLERIPLKQAKSVVAIVPVDFLQYYVESTRKAGSFKVLPHKVLNYESCIYLTKHSFLTNQFDDVLVWIQDFGFVEAWAHQLLDRHYYSSQHLNVDRIFGLQQLDMVFMAVVGGHCVATLVFVMELLYTKYHYRKFKYIE